MKMHNVFELSNSKLHKLISNDNWDVLYHTAAADRDCRGEIFDSNLGKKVEQYIEQIKEKQRTKLKDSNIRKAVNGNKVMELLNLSPGPEVGQIIQHTVNWILDEQIDITSTELIDEFILQLKPVQT